MTTVLTYGTFDLFHIGHLRLLQRLSALGSTLVVGVSTDGFNATKGKHTVVPYADRAAIVAGIRGVDEVIPEHSWDQKPDDIQKHGVGLFVMGSDWEGKFDDLAALCEVRYLPRTEGVSSTEIKSMLRTLDPTHIRALQDSVSTLSAILSHYGDLK